jgi:hypothetical protein
MAADLAHRSYISSTLLDTFLEGTPEVTEKHVRELHKKTIPVGVGLEYLTREISK